MRKNFFANTMALTLTAQLLRIAGILLIAYLTGKIGAEGVGLYQLIMSVYFLAATLASSGIGSTVSRLVAESLGKSGGKSTCNVLRGAICASLVMGAAAGAAVYFLADFIGLSLLGDARAVPAVRMLASGLPFMALTSCLQGYFFGIRKALQPSCQMLFEQAVRILLILAVIDIFIPMGLASSCFAVILCCMISEALSCACGFVLYIVEARRSALVVVREPGVTRSMLRIAAPLALTGYLRAGLKTAENMLIPSGLRAYGASEARALSQYAQIGMTFMVLFFPSGVLGAAATLLMPEVSEARAARSAQKVRHIFSKAFQLTILFSLLLCAIFLVLGGELGVLIYHNAQAGALISSLAPLVPLLYLDFVVDALMTGLGQQIKALRINTLDYAMRVALMVLLIPRCGFSAYIGIIYGCSFLNAVLSIRRLLMASGAHIDYPGWVLKPLLSAAISALLASLLQKMLFPAGGVISALLQAAVITAVYIALLFITCCLTRGDIVWMRGVIRGAMRRPDKSTAPYAQL